MKRQEQDWPRRLDPCEPGYEGAVEELRRIIRGGLQGALKGRAAADRAFLEDVCQMALIRVIGKLNTFEGRSRFTSWAMAIAIRVAFNELRRKEWNAVSIEALRERGESGVEEAADDPLPSESAERGNLLEFLRETMASELTEKQKTVLLAELSGMPQEEIASQLGTTRNNVYKLFHDARKALKRELEKRGFGISEMREAFADRRGRIAR